MSASAVVIWPPQKQSSHLPKALLRRLVQAMALLMGRGQRPSPLRFLPVKMKARPCEPETLSLRAG